MFLPQRWKLSFKLSGPAPLKWSFHFLSGSPALRWLPRCRLAPLACQVHSSSPDLLIPSPNSLCRSVSCLAPLAWRAARPDPRPAPSLAWNPEQTPAHPGPDSRNRLRKCSNGYQISGSCLRFSELNICLVAAASTGTTWPHGSLWVADFSFFFCLKKQENSYQITHDVNAKLCCEMTANMLFSRCLTRQ